jgi:hypothetical protein
MPRKKKDPNAPKPVPKVKAAPAVKEEVKTGEPTPPGLEPTTPPAPEPTSDDDQSDVDQPKGDQPKGDQSDADQSDADQSDDNQSDVDQSDVDQSDVNQPDLDQSDADQLDADQSDVDQSDADQDSHGFDKKAYIAGIVDEVFRRRRIRANAQKELDELYADSKRRQAEAEAQVSTRENPRN